MDGESRFSRLEILPPDLGLEKLPAEYNADNHPQKVSLGAGVYRSEDGKHWILPAVKKAEERILEDPCYNHEYLPIEGNTSFLKSAQEMLFNENTKVVTIQTLGGTGANHLGAVFLSRSRESTVWISDPTWLNHHQIWELLGSKRKLYPYYDNETRALDFNGMMTALETAAPGDIVLLHACCHNPTGVDPNKEQWIKIANLMERKQLFPFFDAAYLGFASGNTDKDAWPIQYFASRGFEMCVAQSFAKSFGLYGERAGALHVVISSEDVRCKVSSQLTYYSRAEVSTAPAFGSQIVSTILQDRDLKREWTENLTTMAERLKRVRWLLYEELCQLKTPGSWEHIVHQVKSQIASLIQQVGMFSYTGLTKAQVQKLKSDYHIYMLDSGRMSMSGCAASFKCGLMK